MSRRSRRRHEYHSWDPRPPQKEPPPYNPADPWACHNDGQLEAKGYWPRNEKTEKTYSILDPWAPRVRRDFYPWLI